MQLIEAAAAGITGAESGSLLLYRRGTSTAATWYTDYEGTTANSSGAAIALDSDGAAIVYVNDVVRVVARDSDGATVRTFTVGGAAPLVEYQGQSFSGTNYESGEAGAGSGYPARLQAILDAWKDSAGAVDWKVLIGATATDLDTAFGSVSGMFFNVKSPAYGAVGDGVTDDTVAIAAAITAANLETGAIVFFPRGTYRTTSALTVSDGVSLWGSGSAATSIMLDAPSGSVLAISGSAGAAVDEVHGLRIENYQSNSTVLVTIADGARRVFRDCQFGQSGTTVDLGGCVSIAASTTTEVYFDKCRFRIATTATASLITSASSAYINLRDCTLKTPASYTPTDGVVHGNNLWLDACVFDHVSSTAGTIADIKFNTTTCVGSIARCNFSTDGGSAAITAMTLGTYASGSMFRESDNVFGTDVTAYSYTYAFASAGAQVMLNTRTKRHKTVVSTSAAPSLETDQYGMITLDITVASNVVMSVVTPPAGNGGSIFIDNHDGTARIYSILPGAGSVDPASGVVDASNQNTMIYSIMETGTAAFWACNWSYTP